jgi:hypothetical protein
MPFYALRKEEVNIILDSLSHKATKASSTEEHNLILNLKNTLLQHLYDDDQSSTSLTDDEDIDVWSAFSGDK